MAPPVLGGCDLGTKPGRATESLRLKTVTPRARAQDVGSVTSAQFDLDKGDTSNVQTERLVSCSKWQWEVSRKRPPASPPVPCAPCCDGSPPDHTRKFIYGDWNFGLKTRDSSNL